MFIGDQAEETACNRNGVVLENVGSCQYLGRVIAKTQKQLKN